MRVLDLIRQLKGGTGLSAEDKVKRTLLRRRRLLARAEPVLSHLPLVLLALGAAYLLLLPLNELGKKTYVDENAIQPAQVNTYWNWADVHICDLNAETVEGLKDADEARRTRTLVEAFEQLGIPTATQSYTYTLGQSSVNYTGTNVFAILPAPKTDGAEAIVLGASWLSRWVVEGEGRRLNVRGVSIVLALANYLKKYSMWSKDIVFVISDGYSHGMHAFLAGYHGHLPSNLKSDPLQLTSGGIWAGMMVDYPYHSFDRVELGFQGANAQLPNQDLLNTAAHILRHMSIPVSLSSSSPITLVPPFNLLNGYLSAGKALARQLKDQALGRPSGPEGAFGKWMIDAVALYAVPAEGPHGFYSLGHALESILRSLNNLLEKLHQSFFLYLFTSLEHFIPTANYVGCSILLSASLTVKGIAAAGKLVEGSLMSALGRTMGLHVAGAAAGTLVALFGGGGPSTLLLLVLAGLGGAAPLLAVQGVGNKEADGLRAVALLVAGLGVGITTTLNFGLALVSATIFVASLALSSLLRVRPAWLLLSAIAPTSAVLLSSSVTQGVSRVVETDLVAHDFWVAGSWSVLLYGYGVVAPVVWTAAAAALVPEERQTRAKQKVQ